MMSSGGYTSIENQKVSGSVAVRKNPTLLIKTYLYRRFILFSCFSCGFLVDLRLYLFLKVPQSNSQVVDHVHYNKVSNFASILFNQLFQNKISSSTNYRCYFKIH